MKIIDISWPISKATTGYKDRHIVALEEVKNFNRDGVRETCISLSSHTGTHIDAPSHFLRDGLTIDQVALDRLIGRCKVLNLTGITDKITYDDLAAHTVEENDIIVLKTSNSIISPTEKFSPHFISLDASGAQYLIDKNIKAVGIDYLGIERSELPGHPVHTILMQADIVIIEGLRLHHVEEGMYVFVCLPLFTIGVEAAPARAILIPDVKSLL